MYSAIGQAIVVLWHIPVILFILVPLAMLVCCSFVLLYKDVLNQLQKGFFVSRNKEEKPVIIDLITRKAV